MDVTALTVVVICANTAQNVGGEKEIVPLVQLVTGGVACMLMDFVLPATARSGLMESTSSS